MLEDIYVPATISSPEIELKFSESILNVSGESYPENVSVFYGPILQALGKYLESINGVKFEVNVRLSYFNSSSTKVIYNMFRLLNEAAANGNSVVVNWYYDEDDDMILEFGQDLCQDYQAMELNMKVIEA